MKYACVIGLALLLQGCHPGDVVAEISRPDPVTGKTPGQVIAEGAFKAIGNPYNLDNWITVATAVSTLVLVGFGVKKSTANHSDTQTQVSDLADTVAGIKTAISTTKPA